MKKTLFVIFILSLFPYFFFADPVYKSFLVNGEKINKWVETDVEEVYEYDERGFLSHVKLSSGEERWYEFNHLGKLTRIISSLGTEEIHEYDEEGNEIHGKFPSGFEFWTEYNKSGNKTYYRDSYGIESTFVYTKNGKKGFIIQEIYSSGDKSVYEYDANGLKTYEKSANGNEYWTTYDKNGNAIYEKASFGYECWSDYDDHGNIIHYITCSDSHLWEEFWFEYDYIYQDKTFEKPLKMIRYKPFID